MATNNAGPDRQIEWLNVRDFGAKGDGATDDTAALLRARRYMLIAKRDHYNIFFPPGYYSYTNNRWLMGIRSVSVDGFGASLVHEPEGPTAAKDLFTRVSGFTLVADSTADALLMRHGGWRIRDVEAGAGIVQLEDPLAADVFEPGHRVLIYGLDDETVQPVPSTRYAEWNRVVGVDRTTGQLVLSQELQYSYRGDWHERLWCEKLPVGKPRIVTLDQTGRLYPHYVQISGVHFRTRAGGDAESSLSLPSEQLILRDCRVEATLSPWQNRLALVEGCAIDRLDGGAMCGTLAFDGCQLGETWHQLHGAQEILLKGNRINGRLRFSSRSIHLVGNLFSPSGAVEGRSLISIAGNSSPIHLVTLRRNQIVNGEQLDHIIDNAGPRQIVTTKSNERNEIVVSDNPHHRRTILSSIERGVLVCRGDLGNFGVVTDFRREDGEWHLAGTWRQRVTIGEAWYVFDAWSIEEKATQFLGNGSCQLVRRFIGPQMLRRDEARSKLRLRLAARAALRDGIELHHVLGRVTRIQATVVRPYRGTDPEPLLELFLRNGQRKWPVMSLRLRYPGHAESTPSQASGDPTPVAVSLLPGDIAIRTVEISCRSGSRPLSATPSELPELLIELDVIPIARGSGGNGDHDPRPNVPSGTALALPRPGSDPAMPRPGGDRVIDLSPDGDEWSK